MDSKCRCCHIWNEKKNKEKSRILAVIDGKCRRSDLDKIRVYYTNKTLKLRIVNALRVVGLKKKDKNKILVFLTWTRYEYTTRIKH